jgi:hypothetical protein
MPFEHACFISYAHGEKRLMQTFMAELTQALESSLEPYLDITACIDRKLLAPGAQFNVTLARAICRSVCMVVVYSPRYGQHPYCLREFEAMRRLQRRRFEVIGNGLDPARGMIIPIIFRGKPETLPPEIRDNIHYMDFRGFTLADQRIRRNRQYVESIERTAEYIWELHDLCLAAGVDAADDCAAFELPEESQVAAWGGVGKPFPGRNGSQ